jgi:hypothetical protein
VDAARAIWEEWTSGLGFTLEVTLIGDHQPLWLTIRDAQSERVRFEGDCPHDGHALTVMVRGLAETIAQRH